MCCAIELPEEVPRAVDETPSFSLIAPAKHPLLACVQLRPAIFAMTPLISQLAFL
jgi:hypothetical protein